MDGLNEFEQAQRNKRQTDLSCRTPFKTISVTPALNYGVSIGESKMGIAVAAVSTVTTTTSSTKKFGTKKRGAHGMFRLKANQLSKLESGMWADGGCLFMTVDKVNPWSTTAPARRWMMRISIDGRQKDIGLGGY